MLKDRLTLLFVSIALLLCLYCIWVSPTGSNFFILFLVTLLSYVVLRKPLDGGEQY